MSTSLVHVMTVVGVGAQQIEAACESLLNRRVEHESGSFGSDDWSDTDQRAIETFCLSAIRAAHALPVTYYAQYLDGRTVADSRYSLLDWSDGRRRQIAGNWFGVAYYPSAFEESLLAQISKFRRRKVNRTLTEDRWFLGHVEEAIRSAQWLECPYVVAAISHHLGPSRNDDDIFASIDTPLELAIIG